MRGGQHRPDSGIGSSGRLLWSICYTTAQNHLKEYQAMTMSMSTHLSPLVALIVGILILIFPRFLNYFIAVYLIITGLIGLGALRTIGGP